MFPLDDEGYYCADLESHYVETWAAMEQLVDRGLTRTIGLSNFNKRQVEEVLLTAKKYKPAVLQNESHPYLHERDLRDYCRIHGIAFQVLTVIFCHSHGIVFRPTPPSARRTDPGASPAPSPRGRPRLDTRC